MKRLLLVFAIIAAAANVEHAHAAKLRAHINPFQPSIAASRTSGIGPLAVFFSATASTYAAVTSYPYTDIEYVWDFGDPQVGSTVSCGSAVSAGAQNWSCGALAGTLSKNADRGPVAAHVYSCDSGTTCAYTATLTARYGSTTRSVAVAITVTDPNNYYTAGKTVCYYNAGSSPPACPAGGTATATSDAAVVLAALTTDKRVLLNGGDTFSTATNGTSVSASHWTLGSYGTGKATLSYTGTNGSVFVDPAGSSDARVMDLAVTTSGAPPAYIWSANNAESAISNLLFYRMDHSNVWGTYGLSSLSNAGLFFADNTIQVRADSPGGSNSHYLLGVNIAVLGSSVLQNTGSEYPIRSMFYNGLVIAHNRMDGATKQTVALRGQPGIASTYGLVADNDLSNGAGTNPYVIAIDQDTSFDQKADYVIVERNWIHNTVGTNQALLAVATRFSAYRNNIFDLTNAGGQCISISGGSTSNADTNWIYGNTCYSARTVAHPGQVNVVQVQTGAVATVIKNNLLYVPNVADTPIPITDAGTGTVGTADNAYGNTNPTQAKQSPSFTSGSPTAPTGFKPTCTGTSYPCGLGVVVPLWADFFGVLTPNPSDIGAALH